MVGFLCLFWISQKFSPLIQKFKAFFNQNDTNDPNRDTCAILTVEGRTFPVDIFYTQRSGSFFFSSFLSQILPSLLLCIICSNLLSMYNFFSISPVPDYLKSTVQTVMKIHQSDMDGDVLAFLTGQV